MKQWQTYKELELIPDSVVDPQSKGMRSWIAQIWQSFTEKQTELQSHHQRLGHLERCLALSSETHQEQSSPWNQGLALLGRAFPGWSYWFSSDPYIWQTADRSGQIHWHTYHPRTGEKIDFESENEVCVWIEESFYR
jgi:hypothetical protein